MIKSLIAMIATVLALSACGDGSQTPLAAQPKILFIGNSYTFARLDPAEAYNSANVHDLTAPFAAIAPGSPWEPHPWGGVPGIFKRLTDEAGFNYDVSISARSSETLRGHFLNTSNAAWNLRGNIASQKWDTVVLQEQSQGALPVSKGGNVVSFNAYVDKIEQFIHVGAAQSYTETDLFGGLASCSALFSATSCATIRAIPANPNANPNARVFVTETFARPDAVYKHLDTVSDPTSPAGAPIVDRSKNPSGAPAALFYNTLADMTTDLHSSFYATAGRNRALAGVIPVGDAFQSLFNAGLVKTSNFYDNNLVYVPNQPGDLMNLWYIDYLHESKYGAYLYALVSFGTITGKNPSVFGATEKAASDMGISTADALTLQKAAATQLGFAPIPAI